jgi:hypothetical protein
VTDARPVLPGSIYMLARRTTRRSFLLRPDEQMTELFWYLLAVMASVTAWKSTRWSAWRRTTTRS